MKILLAILLIFISIDSVLLEKIKNTSCYALYRDCEKDCSRNKIKSRCMNYCTNYYNKCLEIEKLVKKEIDSLKK